jgi:hypothetical protein
MTDSGAAGSLAVRYRRESRREEWSEQTKLVALLAQFLDPDRTFWTSLENKPLSRLSGVFQKRRGVKSGLPDVLVITGGKSIFVELKSRRGVASSAQKQVRAALIPAGAVWWMALSARRAHGPPPLRRGFLPVMAAAAARALGGTVRRPDTAAAAGPGRGGRTEGGAQTMAGAAEGARMTGAAAEAA